MPTDAEADAAWARQERARAKWVAAVHEDGESARQERPSRSGAEEAARIARHQRAYEELQTAQRAWQAIEERVRDAVMGEER